jgi:hypothetical protein
MPVAKGLKRRRCSLAVCLRTALAKLEAYAAPHLKQISASLLHDVYSNDARQDTQASMTSKRHRNCNLYGRKEDGGREAAANYPIFTCESVTKFKDFTFLTLKN